MINSKGSDINLVKRIHGRINGQASRASLTNALEHITANNEQYVIVGGLDEEERATTEAYIQDVAALNPFSTERILCKCM